MSQTSCLAAVLILCAFGGIIVSLNYPWHVSAADGPMDCRYEIRMLGGLDKIVYAECTNTPLGHTTGYLQNVHYSNDAYDEYIGAAVTLMFIVVLLSLWSFFTVSSDGCCGFCCTGPNRCGLLMVPNIITFVVGGGAGLLYLYGTKGQIEDWNNNGIIGELPNGIVIPTLEFGKYIDFKWHMGLWMYGCSIGLHLVTIILSAFGLCCSHKNFVAEVPYDEDYYDDDQWYDEMNDGPPRTSAPPTGYTTLAEHQQNTKQDMGADPNDGAEMLQF